MRPERVCNGRLNLGERRGRHGHMSFSQKNPIGIESKYNMKSLMLAATLQPDLLDMEQTSHINQVNLFDVII